MASQIDHLNGAFREPVLATPNRYYSIKKSTERTRLDTNTADSGSVIQGSIPCSPTSCFAMLFVAIALCCYLAPSSSGLGHHPLKVAARVRIPLGLPIASCFISHNSLLVVSGHLSAGVCGSFHAQGCAQFVTWPHMESGLPSSDGPQNFPR